MIERWLKENGPCTLCEIAANFSLTRSQAKALVVGLESKTYHGNTKYYHVGPLPEHKRDITHRAIIRRILSKDGWFRPDSRIESTVCRWLVVDGKLIKRPGLKPEYHVC